MNRETAKTVGAIALIGIIVVATFLYGNQQRQKQVRRVQETQKQATKTVTPPASSAVKPQPTNPTPSTGGVGGGSLPATTPSTGGEVTYLIPLALIIGLYQYKRQTKFQLTRALAHK